MTFEHMLLEWMKTVENYIGTNKEEIAKQLRNISGNTYPYSCNSCFAQFEKPVYKTIDYHKGGMSIQCPKCGTVNITKN